MRKWGWIWAVFAFVSFFGLYDTAKAEDVVYLKDGSVVHGMIIEEVPGKSVKVQTSDGNIFVYKTAQIEKITHSATEETQTTTTTYKYVNDWKETPGAKFSKGALFFGENESFPGIIGDINKDWEYITGSTDYDNFPMAFGFQLGGGWYTNNIALKVTEYLNFNFNSSYDYTPNSYVDIVMANTILLFGTEFEADLSLDDIKTSASRPNSAEVFSVYLPLIVGFWALDFSQTDNAGYTYDWTGSTADFGTGIGIRSIGRDNSITDLQFIYRVGSSGEMTNATYGPLVDYSTGKNIPADVSGFGLNFNYGFAF